MAPANGLLCPDGLKQKRNFFLCPSPACGTQGISTGPKGRPSPDSRVALSDSPSSSLQTVPATSLLNVEGQVPTHFHHPKDTSRWWDPFWGLHRPQHRQEAKKSPLKLGNQRTTFPLPKSPEEVLTLSWQSNHASSFLLTFPGTHLMTSTLPLLLKQSIPVQLHLFWH